MEAAAFVMYIKFINLNHSIMSSNNVIASFKVLNVMCFNVLIF